MKLGQIIAPPFSQALSKLATSDLPILAAWKLKASVAVVEAESKKFEEFRRQLVDKFAPKNEKGEIIKDEKGEYKVPAEAVEAFTKEINELLSADVEVPTLKFSSLGDKATLKTSDLMALDGLLVD